MERGLVMEEKNTKNYQRRDLVRLVADLMEQETLDLVRVRLEEKDDPLTIVEDCQEGLRLVGERYERQEYYLSGLIMAGEIFREVMELLSPVIEGSFIGSESGVILLGTVEGDIHDIGKNNLSLLLTCYGFTVHDLGVDVPPAEFLRMALQIQPDIIGLSGLLTSSYDSMLETIRLLRASPDLKIAEASIVIGGNQLNEQVSQYVGADGWVTDAMEGVRLCQKIMAGEKRAV
jgi:methanogenic corrinoid protein MtbC1